MTKSDDKRVPALRFKGFTDEWEQRKLGEHIIVSKQKNKDNLSLPAFSISNKNGFIPQEEQFGKDNTYSKTDKSSNYIVKPKYFAYNPARINVGSIAYQNTITPVLVSSLYEIFRSDNNIDDVFLQYWFRSEYFYKQIQRLQEGGVRQYFFIDKMRESQIYLTNVSEQNKIGSIISKLDKLLTLQQRKLTELQLLRTSLNQQLLKDNSSWKSVKLREILNIRNKQIFPNQQYPLMSFVQKQGVVPKSQRYNRDFLVKGNKKYKVTEKGDFIYSSNNLETGSIGINKTGNATISPVYSVFSSKNYKESLFIGLLSEKKSFIYKMIRFRQGVVYGQWKIPEKDFLNIKIKIPNYQEQEKIITLFTHIDNQFKQENKKLTDLQNFKQFLLQNMFI